MTIPRGREKQLRLPGIIPTKSLKLSANRVSPVVWVRRVRVLRDWNFDEAYVVRDVTLRRGLNVVWTPPLDAGQANALFQSGASGHTAGKSTFCRLIRHLLGEQGFASERARKRIRAQFPTGWVVGDVVLGDHSWGVARPFEIGAHSFCVEGEDLVCGTRQEYSVFLSALGASTVGNLPANTYPSSDKAIGWDHLLPWLSRDQECRFADFLEWRHSSSSSEAPSLNGEDRQFLVRSVLGLISAEEQKEQARNRQLVDAKSIASAEHPLLAHQALVDHRRVERALGDVHLAPPSSDLFGREATAEMEKRAAALKAEEEKLAASPRVRLRAALDKAIQEEAIARRDLQDAKQRLEVEAGSKTLLEGQNKERGMKAILAALPAARGFCNVPMDLARSEGCPLGTTHPVDLAARRGERDLAAELAQQAKVVQALAASSNALREALDRAQAATRSARGDLMSEETAYEERWKELVDDRAKLVAAEKLVGQAEQAARDASILRGKVDNIGRDILESYERQAELRATGLAALQQFSSTFDYVVRAVFGDEVSAEVEGTGRSLALNVDHHGERDSAALSTVKLLAFDFAALVESMEGRGAFPRFLIHDGPREADMSNDIYERLFLFVRELEECFGDKEPSFQYIVTTTTPPPQALQTEPWQRLRLHGVPAEKRLLKCDL